MRKIRPGRATFGDPNRTCSSAREAALWKIVERIKNRTWTIPINLVIQIDTTWDLIRRLALLESRQPGCIIGQLGSDGHNLKPSRKGE